MSSITALTPELFQIHLFVKVIELLLVIESTHEKSNATMKIYEYLVADESGSIILNTKTELEIDTVYEVKSGHTQATEGYLRLYSNEFRATNEKSLTVNTQNNRSLIFLERKSS